MDEQRLSELFGDAVGDAPPASFGRAEVVAASRRATARRRAALVGGTLISVAVLAVGVQLVQREDGQQPAAAGTLRTLDAPRCGPVDRHLVANLTAVLERHGSAASGPAGEVPASCPSGSRAAAVPVAGGTLYVVLAGQPQPVAVAAPDGVRGYALTLNGGQGLTVISIPSAPGQATPLATEVPDLARELAAVL